MKNIGGQAVIEGVMMKSPAGWSVAVRHPNGCINLKTVKTKAAPPFLKLPFIRGVVGLFHAILVGVKAIEFSASIAYQDADNANDAQKGESPVSGLGVAISIGLAIALAIVLFKFLPLFLTTLIGNVVKGVSNNSLFFNLVDGLLRVGIFFLYIFSIGLWKEMRRIYQYHGAEHKVIYAYEAGEDLTIENAKKYKPYHPRCGTSFLLIVMVISIMVFLVIPKDWSFLHKLVSRIVLIPVIAGVSYEVLRFSAKMKNNPIIGLFVLPGLLLQRMTVREPDEPQIEVAISAMKEVLKIDANKEVCTEC
ncbi:membrane protein [Dissulfurispira thermophila]|uniref:Membrane protein n=2 Tax=root TaxID=1 RepID=A0A7G1H582_9BACT|nr:DUF1385 domain-containing protein [Dissulfurispira thermophila]BCB97252.1 membrane protein [Dissulfurispira thermophila]